MRPHRCPALISLGLIALTLLAAPALAAAQPPQPATAAAPATPARETAPPPAARPEDVASVDAIIAALYASISGGAGEKRDWDRFRSLFVPSARLIPTLRAPDGSRRHRALSAEDYVRTSGPMLERNGFFEREIGRKEERYGHIVHVMSAYDSKRTAADAEPFARGINSIQLWNDGVRWWVVTIFWESESPDNPIPASYLKP